MEIIKKLLDIISQFLKFKEQQAFEKEKVQEIINLEEKVKEKTKSISEKKKNAKVDRNSDNVFGD